MADRKKKTKRGKDRDSRSSDVTRAAVDGGGGSGAAGNDPKNDAIQALDKSIAALQETFDLLSAQKDAPATTLNQQRRILQEMGDVNAELLSQQLLHLHLQRMETTVTPPTDQSGKDLADALAVLDQMRNATADFVNFMDLAASFMVKISDHRREVDARTAD